MDRRTFIEGEKIRKESSEELGEGTEKRKERVVEEKNKKGLRASTFLNILAP